MSNETADGTATGAQGTAIRAEGLGLRYGDKAAFADVTLPIRSGRVTAIIGPSGCGKTSFLGCINRLTDLIPGCRVEGRLEIGGDDVLASDVDVVVLRRRVGMIFQKPNPFPMSVRRNLELALREHGVAGAAERGEIVEATLREVGLWEEVDDRLDGPAQALSGGQQQRLCIARALCLRPRVLLYDEPCGALDPLSSGVIEDLILSLRGRLTQVVVTHNLGQARRIADDVAFFWTREGCGRLIEHGPAERIFEQPRQATTAAYVRGERG